MKYFLCGGVLFFLLKQAALPDKQSRPKTKEKHSELILMQDWIYTFTGSKNYGASKDTSMYKDCVSEGSTNLPFNEKAKCSAYEAILRDDYDTALKRMDEFVSCHMNPGMYHWLIKALLDIVDNDNKILPSDYFYIEPDGRAVTLTKLIHKEKYDISAFLVGILQYVLCKRFKMNKEGKDTLNAIGERCSGRTPRKYIGNLGDSITRKIEVISPSDRELETLCEDTQNEIPKINDAEDNEPMANYYNCIINNGCTINNGPIIHNNYNAAMLNAVQSFSCDYYQLLVAEEDVLDTNFVNISMYDALLPRLVPVEIYNRCSSLSTNEGIDELKRFPALICTRNNMNANIKTDPNKSVVYGYIDDVEKGISSIKVSFKPICAFSQALLCNNAFGLDLSRIETPLNKNAWSVYKRNLFEAFAKVGLTNMLQPSTYKTLQREHYGR